MRRAGMMNAGSTISVRIVSRHSSASMIVSVTTSVMTFETTVPSVLVTACCAPIDVVVQPRSAARRSACG